MQIPQMELIKSTLWLTTPLKLVNLGPRWKQECVYVNVCVQRVFGGRRKGKCHLSDAYCVSRSTLVSSHAHRSSLTTDTTLQGSDQPHVLNTETRV